MGFIHFYPWPSITPLDQSPSPQPAQSAVCPHPGQPCRSQTSSPSPTQESQQEQHSIRRPQCWALFWGALSSQWPWEAHTLDSQIKRKKKKSSETLLKATPLGHDTDKIWAQICHAAEPASVHYTEQYFHSPRPTIFWTEDWNYHSPIKEPCGAALPKRMLGSDGKALNLSCPKPSHMGPRTWNAASVTDGFWLYFIYFTFK